MKKWILCILIVATMFSATACSDSGKKNSYNASTTAASTTSENKTEPEETKVMNSSTKPSEKKEVSITLHRFSCAPDNGFDKKAQDSRLNSDVSHKEFEVFSVAVSGAKKQSDGSYTIAEGSPLTVSFTLIQDLDALPRIGHTGWWNWYNHYIENCTYQKQVYGTDLEGEPIGRAAYYIEVEYADGSVEKFHEFNFTNGMSKNTVKNVALDCKAGETLTKVSIVIVYRTLCQFYTNLMWYNAAFDWRIEGSVDYSK